MDVRASVIVVFESDAVLAVDKPAGTLTVPSRLGAADPRPCLGRALEQARGERLFPIHRLDLEVSGLVLFARTARAQRTASAAFEGRRVRKLYQAVTTGAARLPALPALFRWESRLVRGKKRSFAAPHGKPAVTQARALRIVDPAADLVLWQLEPETGRPHQLRVHLATAGFPIAGDALYGAAAPWRERDDAAAPAIALRAVELDLLDPADRRALGMPGPLRVPPLAHFAAA